MFWNDESNPLYSQCWMVPIVSRSSHIKICLHAYILTLQTSIDFYIYINIWIYIYIYLYIYTHAHCSFRSLLWNKYINKYIIYMHTRCNKSTFSCVSESFSLYNKVWPMNLLQKQKRYETYIFWRFLKGDQITRSAHPQPTVLRRNTTLKGRWEFSLHNGRIHNQ